MRTLSRRTFMASTGASVLLKPFIDSIEARAEAPVLKPAFFTMFKGQIQYGGEGVKSWVPTMEGGDLKLAALLTPFEPVKKYMTFVIGLDVEGAPQDWHFSMPTLFTGFNSTAGGNKQPASNESIDMFVAQKMGPNVEVLVVNPYAKLFKFDTPNFLVWGRAENGTIFHKSPSYSPFAIFNEVFGKAAGAPLPGGGSTVDRAAAVERARRSILDAIKGDATSLKARVASAHRPQIDATLDGIRQIETEFIGVNGKMSPEMAAKCNGLPAPEADEQLDPFASEANLNRIMNGLVDVTLASLRCGLRSVFSFQFLDLACQSFVPGKIRPEFKHATKGVTPYHFDHSHFHQGQAFIACEQYIHSFFARLLDGMAKIPTGETNLLEKSLGMYATAMSHNHSNSKHSFFVVGNAGGRVKSNRILTFADPGDGKSRADRRHNDLLISMLQGFGHTDVKTYGHAPFCKGGLPGFI